MLLSARVIPTSVTLKYAQSHEHHFGVALRAKKVTVMINGVYI